MSFDGLLNQSHTASIVSPRTCNQRQPDQDQAGCQYPDIRILKKSAIPVFRLMKKYTKRHADKRT